MYNVPILYIVFNRLDTVRKTFEAIKAIQPKDLYIASDGARKEKEGEEKKVQEVRNYILEGINWDCNIHTFFRDKNVGCKYGPADAIKWFFNNVEQGVVLEDDILATKSFFKYCELLLDKYKDSDNIGYICGCTMENCVTVKKDYFLTTIIDGWGWASWAHVIKDFNPDYASLQKKDINDIDTIIINKKVKKTLLNLSLISANNELDAWDYQMADYMAVHGRYTVFPKKPLVRNVGFIQDSTHTNMAPEWYTDKSYELDIVLYDNPLLDKKYTKKYEASFIYKRSWFSYFYALRKYGIIGCVKKLLSVSFK